MKKVHIILFCFIVLLFAACQKENDDQLLEEEVITDANEKANDSKIDTQEKANDKDMDPNQDQISVEDSLNKPPLKIEEDYAILVDLSLKGIDLIKAAKVVNPVDAISYDIKSIFGAGDMIYTTLGSMTKVGNSYKKIMESQNVESTSEGKMVTIYNSDEKMMYQYYESTMTGYQYLEDFKSGMGPTLEGEYDLTTLYAEGSNLIEAEVIQYNEDVIMYFVIMEAGNKVASWVSLKYGITIKSEVYDSNGQVVARVDISNIHVPEGIDSSYFMPPNEVIFEDYTNVPIQ